MARLNWVVAVLALWLAAPASAASVDQWRPLITEASMRFGVPQDWIARVIHAESRGRIDALSPKGAMGLMQLMPGTWTDMRPRLGLGADPFDPRGNILAGTLYLRMLYDRFGYPGLFAAYNAGPQRYADQLTGKRALPFETRTYVAQVSAKPLAMVAVNEPVLKKRMAPTAPSQAGLFFALSTAQSGQ